MAFSRRLLALAVAGVLFAEDREQHMRWVLDGVRVDWRQRPVYVARS